MLLIKVKEAKYLENYKLELVFNDGFNGIIDLENKIFSDHRAIFKPLQEIEYFKSFTQNNWTIEWENGVDFAPEYLYELVEKQSNTIVTEIQK
ncbi:MAG: DUF2442 domain-containing protein [Bacteroidota bacterium]|nr:DUF2442 domain-containing protein [Bacteroidota bacterium]